MLRHLVKLSRSGTYSWLSTRPTPGGRRQRRLSRSVGICRPSLEKLEERLPPGDGLGLLLQAGTLLGSISDPIVVASDVIRSSETTDNLRLVSRARADDDVAALIEPVSLQNAVRVAAPERNSTTSGTLDEDRDLLSTGALISGLELLGNDIHAASPRRTLARLEAFAGGTDKAGSDAVCPAGVSHHGTSGQSNARPVDGRRLDHVAAAKPRVQRAVDNGTATAGERPRPPARPDTPLPNTLAQLQAQAAERAQTDPACDATRAIDCKGSWNTYGENAVAMNAITMGVFDRPESGTQVQAYHGASACIEPAETYTINFSYDLYTWDSYNPDAGGGTGYWDSFSVSVTDKPYPQLTLADPVNNALPQQNFVEGGTVWGDGILEQFHGTGSITVAGRPYGTNYLNVVLDTATPPTFDEAYPSWGRITVTNMPKGCVDLDVDSDNDNAQNAPARNEAEEQIEDDAAKPGKYAAANVNDKDADGVVDFADGFNQDGTAGNADDANASDKFTPIVLEVPGGANPPGVKYKLSYSGSDPAGVTKDTDGVYTRPSGDIRVWKKDGNAAQ